MTTQLNIKTFSGLRQIDRAVTKRDDLTITVVGLIESQPPVKFYGY